MLDVAVVGAGLAGLVCANATQQAGYRVAIVEKSRGVGGRLATRRLAKTWADHGVRYLREQGDRSRQLISTLQDQGILQVWTETPHRIDTNGTLEICPRFPCYSAARGMTAVAKTLATDLDIHFNQRVVAITPQDNVWHLTLESADRGSKSILALAARAIALMIPAPQALTLVEPLVEQGVPRVWLQQLQAVRFSSCLSVMAVYADELGPQVIESPWQLVSFSDDPDLVRMGWDSSKRSTPTAPVLVIQSTADYAQQYLDTVDLTIAGQYLLERTAQFLPPKFNQPITWQIHRWRYAFVEQAVPQTHLAIQQPLPLACGGDWCGGQQIESALTSGLAAAEHLSDILLH
jgi:hypothetical protein